MRVKAQASPEELKDLASQSVRLCARSASNRNKTDRRAA